MVYHSAHQVLSLAKNSLQCLTGLTGFRGLTELDVSSNHVASLAPLAAHISLQRLNANGNRLQDLCGLVGAPLV
jgi:Leucine-rich repeat (LRR) protein